MEDIRIYYKCGKIKTLKAKLGSCVDCGTDIYCYLKSKKRCDNCTKIHNHEISKPLKDRYVRENPEKVKQTKRAYYERNIELVKARSKKFAEDNKEYVIKRSREHYQKNREAHSLRGKKYREKNKEKIALSKKLYYKKNKERIRKYYKSWMKKNHHIITANSAKHKLTRSNRVVGWANLEKIKEIYKNCPKDYQVDHIIPLKAKNVSGLHVDYNLQYLTEGDNHKKRNKFKEEYLLINAENQRKNTLEMIRRIKNETHMCNTAASMQPDTFRL